MIHATLWLFSYWQSSKNNNSSNVVSCTFEHNVNKSGRGNFYVKNLILS